MLTALNNTITTHVDIPDSFLSVSQPIYDLVVNEILPDLGMEPTAFWELLNEVIREMSPKNNLLLLKRYHQPLQQLN